MYKPKCSHPLLLFNKYVLTMVQNGGSLYLDNNKVCVPPTTVSHFPIQKVLDRGRSFSMEQLDASYCELSGQKEPVFLYVPCGHCDLCLHSKQIDIINRTTLESLTWDCPPFFFTLTYDDPHLPCLEFDRHDYFYNDKNVLCCDVSHLKYPKILRGELNYKDVQNFFKRLRIRWTRKGLKHDVRYLVAGEYGSKYGRPHYHVILFNNPYHADELKPHLYDELREDIFLSWGKCKPQGFDFGQCKGGAAPYATKYVLKPQVTHGHHVKPFVRMSSGLRGGLGSIFLKDYIDYLQDNPSINYLEYTDRLGRYQYMYLSKSFTQKVWKSPSSTVPASLRNLYRQFLDNLTLMNAVNGIGNDDAYWLAEALRPSKFVRNDFKVVSKHNFPGTVCKRYYVKRFAKVLDRLIDDLTIKLVDNDNYISNYYAHRSFFVPRTNDDLAPLVVKVQEKLSVLLDKSIF